MKHRVVIAAFAVAMALGACGGDSSSSSESSTTAPSAAGSQASPEDPVAVSHPGPKLAMSGKEIANLPRLRIQPFTAPEPEKLIVRDLRKGSGVAVEPGDIVRLSYAGAHYGHTGTVFIPPNEPSESSLSGMDWYWKKGLPGMRVGGRRELIIPGIVTYPNGTEHGTYVYLVDLLGIAPREAGSP
jgi:peptidylprolyl isomerase